VRLWSCSVDGMLLLWDSIEQKALLSVDSWKDVRLGSIYDVTLVDNSFLIGCTQNLGILVWSIGCQASISDVVDEPKVMEAGQCSVVPSISAMVPPADEGTGQLSTFLKTTDTSFTLTIDGPKLDTLLYSPASQNPCRIIEHPLTFGASSNSRAGKSVLILKEAEIMVARLQPEIFASSTEHPATFVEKIPVEVINYNNIQHEGVTSTTPDTVMMSNESMVLDACVSLATAQEIVFEPDSPAYDDIYLTSSASATVIRHYDNNPLVSDGIQLRNPSRRSSKTRTMTKTSSPDSLKTCLVVGAANTVCVGADNTAGIDESTSSTNTGSVMDSLSPLTEFPAQRNTTVPGELLGKIYDAQDTETVPGNIGSAGLTVLSEELCDRSTNDVTIELHLELHRLRSEIADMKHEKEEASERIDQYSLEQGNFVAELRLKSDVITEQGCQIEELERIVSHLRLRVRGEVDKDVSHSTLPLTETSIMAQIYNGADAPGEKNMTSTRLAPSLIKENTLDGKERLHLLQNRIFELEAKSEIDSIQVQAITEEYEMQIQRLMDADDVAHARSERLLADLEIATAELNQLRTEHDEHTSTCDKFRELNAALVNQNAGLVERIADLQSEMIGLEAILTELKAKILSVQAENERYQQQSEVYLVSLADRGDTLQEMRQKVLLAENAATVQSNQLRKVMDANSQLEQENIKFKADYKCILDDHSFQRELYRELQATLLLKEMEYQALVASTTQTSIQNEELRAAVHRLTVEKSTILTNMKQLQRRYDQIAEFNEEIREQNDNLRKEFKDVTEEVTILTEESIKLTDKVSDCTAEIQEHSEQRGRATMALVEANTQIQRLKEQLTSEQASFAAALESRVSALSAEVSRSKIEHCEVSSALNDKTQEIQSLVEANARLAHDLESAVLQRENQHQSSDVLIFQNSVLQREKLELTAKNSQQANEIESLRKIVEEYQRRSVKYAADLTSTATARGATPRESYQPGKILQPQSNSGLKSSFAPRIFEIDITDFSEPDSKASSGGHETPQQLFKFCSPRRGARESLSRALSPSRLSPPAYSNSVSPARYSKHSSVASMRYDTNRVPKKVTGDGQPISDMPGCISGNYSMSVQDLTAEAECRIGTHSDWVRCVSWSPDGAMIATGSHSKLVCVWSVVELSSRDLPYHDKTVSRLQGHEGWVMSVAWNNDSNKLASASFDCSVIIWNPRAAQVLHILRTFSACHCVSWSCDGCFVAAGTTDKNAYIWHSESGSLLSCLKGHSEPVVSLAWSPVGNRIASGSWDSTVHVYSPTPTQPMISSRLPRGVRNAQRPLHETASLVLDGHDGFVLSVCWSDDSRLIASSSSDCSIRLWDSKSGQCVHCLLGHQEQVTCISFRPQVFSESQNKFPAYLLASASADNSIIYWDGSSGEQLDVRKNAHAACITSLAWAPSASSLVTASVDKCLKLW
jgi:WD40 repeat protein